MTEALRLLGKYFYFLSYQTPYRPQSEKDGGVLKSFTTYQCLSNLGSKAVLIGSSPHHFKLHVRLYVMGKICGFSE